MVTTGFKPKNKLRRKAAYLNIKKSKDKSKRDERFSRRREEDRNPALRVQRQEKNVPTTIDKKRQWDLLNEDYIESGGIGLSVDVGQLKRQKLTDDVSLEVPGLTESKLEEVSKIGQSAEGSRKDDLESDFEDFDEDEEATSKDGLPDDEDDLASLLEDSEDEAASSDGRDQGSAVMREPSPTISATSTTLSLIPDALAAKFPALFKPPDTPKILITTVLNGTIHREAELFTALFPNSSYVPRTRHRYNSHHFSLREIVKFASNRGYTTLLVLGQDQKRPSSLTIIHLPSGPTFHFSIGSWIEGKKLPGHGNPTEHYPELILNNFHTPLGLLTAHMFRTLFPLRPEIEGRQVVTLHNQRDYIFVRRHRYAFRDKRATEKQVVGVDGKPVRGVEEIRAGLQELGPRFTLKLRRIDQGIQRASGQEWEWKARMEKQRTKFQL